MSKLLLTKTLNNFLNAEKKYKKSIQNLKQELKENGYNLKTLCHRAGLNYVTVNYQFKNSTLSPENYKIFVSFLS